MDQLILSSSWNKFNSATATVISASSFKRDWLWGIPITSISNGYLSDKTINSKLLQSQAFVENYLGIKLFKQYITETQDFVNENFFNWGYIKLNWPINEALSLSGKFNEQDIIDYPVEWLTTFKGQGNQPNNNLYIVPNGLGGNVNVNYLAVSMSQYFGFHNARIIPNYWNIGYCTGFDIVPGDIVKLISMFTAIDILLLIEMGIGVLGGGSLGNSTSFGAASNSLSLDGLSQSVSKMNGGNIFQNRIKQYYDQTTMLMNQLRYSYGGIKFDVC